MLKLSLTVEQAKVVATACEFYASIRMGQFQEVPWRCLNVKGPNEYMLRREEAERLLFEARKQIYPDLQGDGDYYGLGEFKDADLAFSAHQVIQYALGGPYSSYSYYDLPGCQHINNLVALMLSEEQARNLANACEVYARVRVGEFQQVARICMPMKKDTGDFHKRSDEAWRLLWEARKQIYPDLHSIWHTYGFRKFDDASVAFDVHQAIRYTLDGARPFCKPCALIQCEVEE